jgi:hypothetical protein
MAKAECMSVLFAFCQILDVLTIYCKILNGSWLKHLMWLLTVNSCIKLRLDLQEDKSLVVVKGRFFPRVVNPRYRIRGTNV